MRRKWRATGIGALIGTGAGIPILLLCVLYAGGGHGYYRPMIVCFPFTMLLAVPRHEITPALACLGLAQFPAYGALLSWPPSRLKRLFVGLALGATHLSVTLFALSAAAKDRNFWP
jgi:hypothetical protein